MVKETRKCPQCQAEVPLSAHFCSECGASLGEISPQDRGKEVSGQRSSRESKLWWLVGLLLGIALVLGGWHWWSRKTGASVVVQSPRPLTGPGVLQSPPRPLGGPPVTQSPRPPLPPPDPNRQAVAEYLNKMARIEAERKDIVNNLFPAMFTLSLLRNLGPLQDALVLFDEDLSEEKRQQHVTSVEQAEQTINAYIQQLQEVAIKARKITPPPPAQRFARAYDYAVSQYITIIAQIRQAMLSNDVSIGARARQLSQLKDQALMLADQELERLVNRYRLPKLFSVSDRTSAPITAGP